MTGRRCAVLLFAWLACAGAGLPARAADAPAWVEAAFAQATPPWAAKADALVLENSQEITVTASGHTLTRTRRAVRVLGPTGANAAGASADYLRGTSEVKSLDAWEGDGSGALRHLGGKDAVDISASGSWSLYSDARSRSLAASRPLPGSVFASETVVEDAPLFAEFTWFFDGTRPSLHSRLTLVLPPGIEPTAHPGRGNTARTSHDGTRWTWETSDLPARTSESMAPHRADDGSQVYVSLGAASGAAVQLPGATFDSWPAVAQWLDRLEAPQCVLTPAISARVRGLLGAERDTLQRIGALARDVQQTNYVSNDLGLARGWGYRPHPAEQVLAAGYGDCKDKSNLLCALLRAAGHEAWMVSAYSGGRHHVVPDRPTPLQFNHCIVVMRVPQGTVLPAVFRHPALGTLLAFDPTDRLTTFGDLPEDEQGSLVLIDLPAGSELVRLPVSPAESRGFDRSIRATLAADGRLEAHVEERSRGQAAVQERALRHDRDQAAYRRILENWLAADRSSVELGEFRTVEDSLAGTFRLSFDYAAPGFARRLGTGMLSFRPAAVSSRSVLTLPDSARTQPIQVPAECFRESVTVELPAGMRPDDLPAMVERTTDFGSLHAEWTMVGGSLQFVRTEITTAVLLPAGRYADVRAFYALAHRVPNTPVVLIKN